MSTDNTDAFASDVAESRATREELERQLAELDSQTAETDPEATNLEDGADIIDDDADAPEEWQEVDSELLGRTIRVIAPTDVAVTMFQQNMSSRVASPEDKIAEMGDFVRRHVHPMDFHDWQTAILTEAGRNRKHAFGAFKRQNEAIIEKLMEISSETDEDYIKEEMNRSERRAALKRKQARLKAGQDRR